MFNNSSDFLKKTQGFSKKTQGIFPKTQFSGNSIPLRCRNKCEKISLPYDGYEDVWVSHIIVVHDRSLEVSF